MSENFDLSGGRHRSPTRMADVDDRVLQLTTRRPSDLHPVKMEAQDFVLGTRFVAPFASLMASPGPTISAGGVDSGCLLDTGRTATPCRFRGVDPRVPYRVGDNTITFLREGARTSCSTRSMSGSPPRRRDVTSGHCRRAGASKKSRTVRLPIGEVAPGLQGTLHEYVGAVCERRGLCGRRGHRSGCASCPRQLCRRAETGPAISRSRPSRHRRHSPVARVAPWHVVAPIDSDTARLWPRRIIAATTGGGSTQRYVPPRAEEPGRYAASVSSRRVTLRRWCALQGQ